MSSLDYIQCPQPDAEEDEAKKPSASGDEKEEEEEAPSLPLESKEEDSPKKKKKKKAAAAKKKQKKKKKSGDKKKKKKGGAPFTTYRDEPSSEEEDEEDMLKFDDAELAADALDAKSRASTQASTKSPHVIDSDDDEDDDEEEESEEEGSEEEEESDYESIRSSDLEDVPNDSDEEGGGGRGGKKRKVKKKRKARATTRGTLWARLFGGFSLRRKKKDDKPSVDERVPINLAPVAARAAGHRGVGPSYGEWDPTSSEPVGGGLDFDADLVRAAANDIRADDVRRAKRFRKRCCIFLAVLVVVASLTVGGWFEWGTIKRVFHRGKGGGGGTGTSAGGKGKVGPPFDVDADVTNTCSEDNVAKFQGYYACRGLCDSAYCCFLPPWESHSCARTFRDQCRSYVDSCAILDRVEQPGAPGAGGGGGAGVKSTLPPADPNLQELCSGSEVGTKEGLAACNAACEPGKCCFAGQSADARPFDDCYDDNKYACAAYHPCLDAVAFQTGGAGGGAGGSGAPKGGNLAITVHNYKLERRRLVLEQACSRRGMAVSNACERYCEGYECCFVPLEGKAAEEPCADEQTCMENGACAALWTSGRRS